MKRTAPRITISSKQYNVWDVHEKITCEVCGEMSHGAKVWQDVSTGEQYFLCRMLGKYYFYRL